MDDSDGDAAGGIHFLFVFSSYSVGEQTWKGKNPRNKTDPGIRTAQTDSADHWTQS